MEQQTGSKLGKEYRKAVYCHLAYLTYMQSTSCKMPGWMKHKLESRLPGEISVTSEPPPRVIEIKTKVNKWDLIKLKSFCTAKGTISKGKENPQNGRR